MQLRVDMPDVIAHRVEGDEEPLSDHSVVQPLDEERQDLVFPSGEGGARSSVIFRQVAAE